MLKLLIDLLIACYLLLNRYINLFGVRLDLFSTPPVLCKCIC
ncbi:hypothetical protein Hanom_Chr00s001323g01679971 [Helianthus anomalus]